MAANDNAISCGTEFTLTELLASAIGKDATGKPYLRLYATNNVSGSKFFDCGQPVDPTNVDSVLKNLFTLDSNGDVALRTGTA
jgi:hypothetical protein